MAQQHLLAGQSSTVPGQVPSQVATVPVQHPLPAPAKAHHAHLPAAATLALLWGLALLPRAALPGRLLLTAAAAASGGDGSDTALLEVLLMTCTG